jgi:hypothetical protein
MPLTRENRQRTSRSAHLIHALRIALAISFVAGLAAHLPAQLPEPAPPPPSTTAPMTTTVGPVLTPTAPAVATRDPLKRETPHSALMGLLKYGAEQDFATAARYLQPAPGKDTDLVERATELQALYSNCKSNIALLSDDPNGSIDAGVALYLNRGFNADRAISDT